MAFDGFVTKRISIELKKALSGGRIEKIYHPSKSDLVFVVANNKEKFKVFLSADSSHFGIYTTDDKFENPKTASSFNMLLRKHIGGGKIKDISQVGWERIIEIVIEAKDEMGYPTEKKIIIEIMNKQSNIILVESKSMKIIDALKRTSFDTNSVRQLLPSMKYFYPPTQDKISPQDFVCLKEDKVATFTGHKDFLNSILGISPVVAVSLELSSNPQALMKSYLKDIDNFELYPKVYLDDKGVPKDYHYLPLESLHGFESKVFSSMSEAINFYYTNRLESNRLRQKSSDIEKKLKNLIKKLSLKKQRLLDDIKNAENSQKFQLYGELITANLHNIKAKTSSVTVLNYYDNKQISIPLDERLSPIENAQRYFKKYNKAKRALVEKKVQIDLADSELTYLSSSLDFLHLADSSDIVDSIRNELIYSGYIKDRKTNSTKKSSKLSFTTYKTPSGLELYVGRNNKENDYLSTKFASKSDLWFHTKDISSSHVILSLKGTAPTEEDIIFASEITAYYSKARMSENVPVDYTYIKYVKKPKGAKLGMVIFTNNKTIYVDPHLPK